MPGASSNSPSRTLARPERTSSPTGLSICTRYPMRLRRGTRRSYQTITAEETTPITAVPTATTFSALNHSIASHSPSPTVRSPYAQDRERPAYAG